MARILLIHSERKQRKFIEARLASHHQVRAVNNLAKGMKALGADKPDVLIAGLDHHKPEALDLLRYIRRNGQKLPVLLIGPAGAGVLQPTAMKLGAAGFLEFPVEANTLEAAIRQAIEQQQARKEAAVVKLPEITAEEQSSNITQLEHQLNRKMVCFAGENQVYIQSMILGAGEKSKPRIALKCSLRKQFGHPPNVYYEYIRDVCCSDPGECPAYQAFKEREAGGG